MARILPPGDRGSLFAAVHAALVLFAPAARGQAAGVMAEGGNSAGFDMAPETRREAAEAAVAAIPVPPPAGPAAPEWESRRSTTGSAPIALALRRSRVPVR